MVTRRRWQQRPDRERVRSEVTEPMPALGEYQQNLSSEVLTTGQNLSSEVLTTEQIRELGRELICELAPAAGDTDAVRAALLRWLADEDTSRLSLVCMSVVQQVFADCLTRTPTGAWTLNPPPERTP
jgi:hypothetical protein